tara:strand:+ start:389 stop:655 length:267 start_codon:yes stop_codon:yes gene_type:complete
MSLEYSEKLEEEYPEVDMILDEAVGKLIGMMKYHFDLRLDPNDLGAITFEALAKWTYLSILRNKREDKEKHESNAHKNIDADYEDPYA